MVARRNLSIGLSDMVQLSALSGYLIKTWCERTLSEYCGWSKGCSYQCLFLCRISMLGYKVALLVSERSVTTVSSEQQHLFSERSLRVRLMQFRPFCNSIMLPAQV